MSEKLMSRREFIIGAASFTAVLAGCSAQSAESPAPADGPAPTKGPNRVCETAKAGATVLGIVVDEYGERAETQVEVHSGLQTRRGKAVDARGLNIGDQVCFIDNP